MQELVVQAIQDPRAMLAGPALERLLEATGRKAELLKLLERKIEATQPFSMEQRATLQALHRAMDDGSVFAAVTGPANTGKTMVLNAALRARQNAGALCVHIPRPDRISAAALIEIDSSIDQLRASPGARQQPIVIAVDNAHTASDALLARLDRFAGDELRERTPQLILVGRPALLERVEIYEALACRIAVRCTLNRPVRELTTT